MPNVINRIYVWKSLNLSRICIWSRFGILSKVRRRENECSVQVCLHKRHYVEVRHEGVSVLARCVHGFTYRGEVCAPLRKHRMRKYGTSVRLFVKFAALTARLPDLRFMFRQQEQRTRPKHKRWSVLGNDLAQVLLMSSSPRCRRSSANLRQPIGYH